MSAIGCTKIVYTPERSRQISDLTAADTSLEAWEAPGLWEVFDDSSPGPVIQEPAEDHEDRVAIYIHSSGTTGTTGHSKSFHSRVFCVSIHQSDTKYSYRNAQASPNDQRLSHRH